MGYYDAPAYIRQQCPVPVEGTFYQGPDGRVYIYQAGQLHYIPDPNTLTALGGGFGAVTHVSDLCVAAYGTGGNVQSVGATPTTASTALALASLEGFAAPVNTSSSYTQPFTSGANVGLTQPTATRPGMFGTLQADFSNVTATLQAHEKAILVGAGVFAAWKLGIFRALMGRRRY